MVVLSLLFDLVSNMLTVDWHMFGENKDLEQGKVNIQTDINVCLRQH